MKPEMHTLPVDDLKPHIMGADCWCNPRVEENGELIIHNSLDRREVFENLSIQ